MRELLEPDLDSLPLEPEPRGLLGRLARRPLDDGIVERLCAAMLLAADDVYGATVDEQALLTAGLIRKPYEKVKILGGGELKKKLSITADKASESAKAAIEKAGGTLTLK